MSARSRLASLAIAALLAGALAGCSDDADPAPEPAVHTADNGDEFNDADAQFAADLVQHHALALTLVDWARGRRTSSELIAISEEILSLEGPEIEALTGLLGDWDRTVPATLRDHSHVSHDGAVSFAGDVPGGDLPGMPSTDDLTSLLGLRGTEFEQRWVELMITHHQGAIELAEEEVEDGLHPAAVDLARTVADTQRDQLERLQAMLDG